MLNTLVRELENIDPVLNEALLRECERRDRDNGFDPEETHDSEELLDFKCLCFGQGNGVELLKALNEKTRYVLLELEMTGSFSYKQCFLRGFEITGIDDHAILAGKTFLPEFNSAIQNRFGIPNKWPGISLNPESKRDIKLYSDGIYLRIYCRGGGFYKFQDDQVLIHGTSVTFGPATVGPNRRLVEEGLQLLSRKEPYKGYSFVIQD